MCENANRRRSFFSPGIYERFGKTFDRGLRLLFEDLFRVNLALPADAPLECAPRKHWQSLACSTIASFHAFKANECESANAGANCFY